MTCNPLVVQDRDGPYVAWCKPHGWEGPERAAAWAARRDADTHAGRGPDERAAHPPWQRGPAR